MIPDKCKCGLGPENFTVVKLNEWKIIPRMDEGNIYCICGAFVRYAYVAQETNMELRRYKREYGTTRTN